MDGLTHRKASAPSHAAADAEEKAKPPMPPAAAAFQANLTLCLLGAALVATYSLESLAPTLDYVGRDIMLGVQFAHLLATAAYGLRADWLLAALLANLAALTRFWRIEDPQSVIFDEVRGARACPACSCGA